MNACNVTVGICMSQMVASKCTSCGANKEAVEVSSMLHHVKQEVGNQCTKLEKKAT